MDEYDNVACNDSKQDCEGVGFDVLNIGSIVGKRIWEFNEHAGDKGPHDITSCKKWQVFFNICFKEFAIDRTQSQDKNGHAECYPERPNLGATVA